MRAYELTEVQWAVGKDSQHATRPHQARQKNKVYDDYELLWVNIEDVFANTERDFTLDVKDPKGGVNAIGDRVQRAKSHWGGGGHMDPSELGVSDYSKKVYFSDGRHRMVAAYQMGQEYAPALVPRGEVEALKNLVRIKNQ